MRHEKYVDINEAVLEWQKNLRVLWELKISPPAMGGWTDFACGITSPFDHCGAKRPMSTPVHVNIGWSVFHCFWLDMMTRTFST
ncbi:hypothetical protein AVEN_177164-1 [Araneus ventricosus]|uniref:Uncharacterized protein n=1 Tax=Araneus ventricosus TaxID=182803 RepID=A0A4Y2QQZ5_ARAVE|nr:hypothetical protein AVEN_177164-1 [Araneus ventricosus]